MGAGASIVDESSEIKGSTTEVILKKLPDTVEESIYLHEKFPIVVDATEQASRFFKYQTGAFISHGDPVQFTKKALNRALVASMLHGRTLTLKFETLEGLNESSIFEPGLFPKEVLDRSQFFLEEHWQSVLKEKLGDPSKEEATISPEFVLILCTATPYIPPSLLSIMHVIQIRDPNKDNSKPGGVVDSSLLSSGDANLDLIASLTGAQEIIRNSLSLVEAAFDGDLAEVQSQIAKGFHLESYDAHKQTGLSEAAAQGQREVVQFLLEQGADPNSLSDTGRSPLWRAAFQGHTTVVQTLLAAGASPTLARDKHSLETTYDVAANEETRAVLAAWDLSQTERLMRERQQVMVQRLEERIVTSAQREALARDLLRRELVAKAEQGDIEGIKQLLWMIIDEMKAVSKGSSNNNNHHQTRPRATVEVRNDQGQSLLSIAAQGDNLPLATFLLTYWKTLQEEEDEDLLEDGEQSLAVKVFRPRVNSRDLKGWSVACIAVFHDARQVLALLLDHGADPYLRSSYHKHAFDLAKDDLDAAEKVVTSRREIREVLQQHYTDPSLSKKNKALLAKGEVVKGGGAGVGGGLYEGLEKEGSAMVMNIEMNREEQLRGEGEGDKKEGKGKKGGKKKTTTGGGNSNKKKAK